MHLLLHELARSRAHELDALAARREAHQRRAVRLAWSDGMPARRPRYALVRPWRTR
jgi:hypothetical protein